MATVVLGGSSLMLRRHLQHAMENATEYLVFIFFYCPASNVVLCFLEHTGSCLTLTVFLSGSGLMLRRRLPDGSLNLTNGWQLRQGFGRQQF